METVNLTEQVVTNLGAVDYTVIFSIIVALIPTIFPAVLGVTAIRKGISWVLGMVKGA